MPEPRDSWLGLARAKQHIRELDAEIGSFLDGEPCTVVSEISPDGAYELILARFVKPLPEKLSLVAFDAIGQMRAVLDRLCHACSISPGSGNTGFPFGDNAAEVESRRLGSSKDVHPEIFGV